MELGRHRHTPQSPLPPSTFLRSFSYSASRIEFPFESSLTHSSLLFGTTTTRFTLWQLSLVYTPYNVACPLLLLSPVVGDLFIARVSPYIYRVVSPYYKYDLFGLIPLSPYFI